MRQLKCNAVTSKTVPKKALKLKFLPDAVIHGNAFAFLCKVKLLFNAIQSTALPENSRKHTNMDSPMYQSNRSFNRSPPPPPINANI